MPAIITSKFRVENAKTFIGNLNGPELGGHTSYDGVTYLYLFIGKTLGWDQSHIGYSDLLVPSPSGDIQSSVFEPWRDMIALSRVQTSEIHLGATRENWTSGTIYTQYDDQNPEVAKGNAPFFVYEENGGNVFKCLDNNNGAASTVRPSKPTAAVINQSFVTTDGYRWKYMFTIPAGAASTFLTENYIPVRTINVHSSASTPVGYEDQRTVQENANNGTIEAYVVVSPGAGYTAHSASITNKTIDGSVVTPNTTFFQLVSDTVTDSLGDDHFNGAAIYVSNTTHIKGLSTIADYGTLGVGGGATQPRCIKLDDAFSSSLSPLSGDTFSIGPAVVIQGDGLGANAYSICTTSGSISQVKSYAVGNSYTYANVTIVTPDNLSGSSTSIRAIIPPPKGHGWDPVSELNAFNVIVSKSLSGAGTGNTFPITNEYRVIGLVRNALLANGYDSSVLTPATSGKNWFANTSPLHQSVWVVANTTQLKSTGDFAWTPAEDEEVIGNTSGAKGRIIEFNSDGRGILNIGNVVPNTSGLGFMSTEQIGLVRDATGILSDPTLKYVTANGASVGYVAGPSTQVIFPADLQPATGEIIYLEYRAPIARSADQSEDILIVIEF